MADAWTWLALAGAGAVHGLNPIAGWGLVAAAGAGPGPRMRALPALAPIALGHAAGVALLAGGFLAGGAALDGPALRLVAGALLALLVPCHLPVSLEGRWLGARPSAWRRGLRRGALAAWSCALSLGHGAGLMLVPVMMATCSATAAPTSSGGWTIVAVAAVHTSAMVATSAVLALAGRRVAGRWMAGLRRRSRCGVPAREPMPDPGCGVPTIASPPIQLPAAGASGCRARHARSAWR